MDTLLDTVLRLHPEDSKTNVFIPFTLERDFRRMEFCCSYEPQFCDNEEGETCL